MAKFSFPSCCCSCSCFSSSSPPQQETIAESSAPSSSPQPSQQQATSSPLRSPQQQTIAGHSTSPPSQPSEKEAIAGPSTASKTDLKSSLQKFNDISQLRSLIQFIEELLKIASGEKSEEGSSSEVSSYIQDGQTFLEFVDKHIGKVKLPEKKDSVDGISAEIQKIVIDLLQGAGKIHWVGAALSVVGFVLARFNQMSNNKTECLEILKRMFNLGKQILQLDEQMPEQKQKLNEAVECIVEGCTMCASQLTKAKVFRFLTASVKADSLKAFQLKIDRLYSDLELWGIIDIQGRLPKIAPQSQELYAYRPAVGIESAQEEVIRLLALSEQHTSPQVVVVYGLGGIGKTTLADAVYKQIDLQSYRYCRIHMDQNCNNNDLKVLQEQILNELFLQKVKLTDCDQGRGMIWLFCIRNPNQPLFLYIDNGLKKTDLRQLLPEDLGSCLPPKSRTLVTTRNLQETDIFVAWNIQRQEYAVSPLPPLEARKILLKKAFNYNDESNIDALLELCGGVPLLLELAGSQLAISNRNTNNIILELLREGEKVEEEDVSDRMVDFVYQRLLPPVKEAFLDITSFFCNGFWPNEEVAYIVGEEEFRALEEASFVKTSEYGIKTIHDMFYGTVHHVVIVHDIVQARGRKMSEQNRITDPETLLECLKDEEKLKTLKGIFIEEHKGIIFNKGGISFVEGYEQPKIEINKNHLNCMRNSLRVLAYKGSDITFMEKCQKPFKQLRCLQVPNHVLDLPMEFEKLEHLAFYEGPFTQGMSLYELPPSLRIMYIWGVSENGVAYSKIPSKVVQASSLVEFVFYGFESTKLPDGLEMLTKLEKLHLKDCNQLRELPSKLWDLSNLKELLLDECDELEELPLEFGQLSNLTSLNIQGGSLSVLPYSFGHLISLKQLDLKCFSKLKELPSNFGQLCNLTSLNLIDCYALSVLPSSFGHLISLKQLDLTRCKELKELPSDFGHLSNLISLVLKSWSALSVLPSSFGHLISLERLILSDCTKLKELPSDFGHLSNLISLVLKSCSALSVLPSSFGQLISLKQLNLSYCTELKELPSDFGQLKNLKWLNLSHCSGLEEWPLSFRDLTEMAVMDLRGCSSKLEESLLHNIRENWSIVFE